MIQEFEKKTLPKPSSLLPSTIDIFLREDYSTKHKISTYVIGVLTWVHYLLTWSRSLEREPVSPRIFVWIWWVKLGSEVRVFLDWVFTLWTIFLFVDDWFVHVIFIYLLYLYWTRKIDLFTSHLSVLVWIEQRAFFINTFPK